MKNFKIIIALTALIAISNENTAQQGKKLTAQDRIELMKALNKQTDIVKKVSQGATATPAMGQEYQKQEAILNGYIKKESPEVQKLIQENRTQLNKTVKNVDTSLEKIKLAIVPKIGVKGTPLTAEAQLIPEGSSTKLSIEQVQKMLPKTTKFPMTAGLSLLSSADKATAILIYDEKTQSLKENGIKIYIANEKKKYPALAENKVKLITTAYNDAVKILTITRNETTLNNALSNQLMFMINNAVYNTKKAQAEGQVEINIESIINQLKKSENWSDFMKISINNNKAFYKNDQVTQRWFNIAAEMAQKFGPTITSQEMRKELTNGAKKILTASGKISFNDEDLENINTSLDIAIIDEEPVTAAKQLAKISFQTGSQRPAQKSLTLHSDEALELLKEKVLTSPHKDIYSLSSDFVLYPTALVFDSKFNQDWFNYLVYTMVTKLGIKDIEQIKFLAPIVINSTLKSAQESLSLPKSAMSSFHESSHQFLTNALKEVNISK